jgi:hypothetical protein
MAAPEVRAMTPGSRSGSLIEQARFVFQGTVKKVKATTLKSVPASDRTIIVRVDRVIQSPEALSDYAGHDVTVQMAPGEKVRPGETLIFYTTGWIFGDSLAVQSVGHEEATAPRVAAMSAHPEDPVRTLHATAAMAQAARADLVVTGRVSSVRVPAGARARAKALAGGTTTERISEHAPMWQEAVIDVDETHKGRERRRQVVVRFPSSTDVRWYRAPKFHAGQEGIFLLHKQQVPAAAAKTASLAGLKASEYTALDPEDFQPLEQLPQIRLAASASATRRRPSRPARMASRTRPKARPSGKRGR